MDIGRDNTEHKQTEERLREYEKLVENLEEMIVVVDRGYRYLLANRAFLNYRCLQKEQILGRTVAEILDPDVFARVVKPRLDECFQGKVVRYELANPYPEIGERVLAISYFPIEGPNGVDRVACVLRDITERKRAEEALRESEERFRQLSEAAFEAIIIHDQGTILEVNQSFCRMYGYERTEVIGKSILEMTLPQFRELFRQKLRSGDTNPYESPVLRKDGTVFNAELAGKPISYRGRVVRVGAVRDITEQKRNERRQAAQYGVTRVLAKSATLAEATPQLLRVICESLRWKMGQFWRVCDGTNLLRCVETWHVPTLDATSFTEASRQIRLAPGVALPGRVWQSGQPAWISDVMTDPGFARAAMAAKVGLRGAVAFPIFLESNTLGVMLFFSRRTPEVDEDLLKMMSAIGSQIGQFTERRTAEDALREAEQKYRDIFENAGEGIFQSTPDGQYIAANPALSRMHGFESPEEFISACQDIAHDVYVDPARREEFIRLLDTHGVVRGFEHQIFRKDGSKIWVSVNARAVRDEQGIIAYYEGTTQDITERKRADARSAAFATLARKLSGARSQLDAGRIIAKTAGDLFGWDSCNLDLYDADRDIIHPMLNVDTIDDKQVDVTAQISNRPPTARHRSVIDHGSQLILREEPITFDPDAIPFGDTSRPSASLMTAPIRHASSVIGLLSIQSYSLHAYDQAALTDLEALADHCGEALNRIRAEELLRESEERYRDLVENSSELMCTHDLNGLVLSANPAAAAAIGCDLDQFVGKKSVRDILAPEVRDQFDEYMARLLKDGATSGIMLVQTMAGETRMWQYYNSLRTEGVAAPVVRGMARDITEERRAQKALYESEERYRELFENAKDALYVHDLSGRYLSFNRAAERLTGYSREEILGKHFSNFVAPSYLRRVRENLCKKLDEEGETTYEIDLVTRDRRRVPVEVNSRLIYENGEPVGVQGAVRDITERKRADDAHHRLALVVDSSDDAIIGKTLDGTIISWNSGAEKIYGYSAKEIIGSHVSVLIPSDRSDELPQILERLRKGESIKHYETIRRRKDGKLIDVSLTMSPIRDGNKKPVGASTIARDITNAKQAEKALKNFSRRLIEAQEAERQHIARELHDEIGQVLTAVRINLQSLRSPGQASSVSLALDDSLAIVDEALECVRELSLNLRPSVLDNLGLASALRWYVDRYARRSGIVADLRNDIEEGRRLQTELETACFRIVQEALTNVVRHARATRVSVDLKRSNGNLELKIKDDGVGFDSGWLLKSAGSSSALGLRGMQERTMALNGRLEIDSRPKSGTEIRVSFPLKDGIQKDEGS